MKKILSLITALTLAAGLAAALPVSADNSGYKALDLSLTQTSFTGLNQNGEVKVYLIAEENVTMPVLSYSNTNMGVLLNGDGTYQTTEGTAETLPRRKSITEGNLTFSTADTSVIELNTADGTFTTKGYGVANVKAVYDNATPADTSDDVSANVMINVSDESKIEIFAASYNNTDMTIMRRIDGVFLNNLQGRSNLYATYQLVYDPLGTVDEPLVLKSINNSGQGEATAAVTPGESAVFSGWFYDTMQNDYQNFISFGYAGNTGAANVLNDGNKSITVSAEDADNYKLLGGVYSSSWAHSNYNYEKLYATGTNATYTKAGVANVGTRKKGWHQFVVTAESSIVNPGTDYMLVKAYLDGELVTAQDIYVGDVPVANRRFNIFCNPRYNTSCTAYYKDLSVRTFKRSSAVTDTIPSANAVNVPLRQLIKVKLSSVYESVPAVTVTSGGNTVESVAALDETGTIVTINAGKLNSNTTYTINVAGTSFSFTTGTDSGMASVLDSMYNYRITDSRYVDFTDTQKTAEEYGVGYVHNRIGAKSEVQGSYATMTESVRAADTYESRNGIIIRNISPRNSNVDRVVVSYKFRPHAIITNQAYSAGIGIPFMAVDNASDSYNHLTTAMMSGARGSLYPAVVVAQDDYASIQHYLLQGNTDGSTSAIALDETPAYNGRIFIPTGENPEYPATAYTVTPDENGWFRLTYVVDTDKSGVNAPTWTTILGDDLNNEKYIFRLNTAPYDTTAYTSVDAIFIPTTNRAAVSENMVTDIKDIEIYNLSKISGAIIADQPTVTETGTQTEVFAGNLSGKTVDVSINAQGNGEAYTVIVAAMDSNNKLLNVKTASGTLGADANIGVTNFAVPAVEEGNTAKIYVFVWNSLEGATPLFEKTEYTKTE